MNIIDKKSIARAEMGAILHKEEYSWKLLQEEECSNHETYRPLKVQLKEGFSYH
jgi:hypothetical protein